uniref:Uncharacterized protein n=1 Tax=Aegilops tauschii subsp. strangulata TaxID=200361 RepID=A0A453LR42_AEGTS
AINQLISVSSFLESKLPRPEFRLFPLLVSPIHAGRHSLLLTASSPLGPPALRGRKKHGGGKQRSGGKKEKDNGMGWIGKKQKRRSGARSLAGPGPGILSAAWGRGAQQGLLLDPSAGLDRMILEVKSEMGASRIARKELH